MVLTHPCPLVVRTSLTQGRSPGGDCGFADEMRRAWAAGRTLQLFTDEVRNPLPVEVTARAVWELVRLGQAGALSPWPVGEPGFRAGVPLA